MTAAILFEVGMLYSQLYPDIVNQQFVPLHYNVHLGVDSFGPAWHLLTSPFIGIIVALINTAAAIFYWKKDHVLSYAFMITGAIVTILSLITTIFIVLMLTSYYG